jgi:hypothetical protein
VVLDMHGTRRGGGYICELEEVTQLRILFGKTTHVLIQGQQAQDQATLGCESPPNGGLQELGG